MSFFQTVRGCCGLQGAVGPGTAAGRAGQREKARGAGSPPRP